MDFLWTVIIFLPLLAALGLFGFFYAKKGYKKGPWRALICLGVTLVAAIVSWLVALVLAKLLAEPVADMIGNMVPAQGVMIAGFVQVLASRLAHVLVAILSFAVLFYILLPVLGAVSKAIKVPQWDEQQPRSKAGRYVGMGIRILDAVMASLLVLLPLYGVMMVGAGPAAIVAGGDVTVLEQAAEHPVKYVYQYGPVAPVINSMTRVTVNGADVNFVDVSTACGRVSQPYAQVMQLRGTDNTTQGEVLITVLKNEVLDTSWCYHFTMEALNEMEQLLILPQYAEQVDMKRQYINAFRMTEMEFRGCSEPMVKTLASALKFNLQNDLLNADQEMPEVPVEFLKHFGNLMNSNNAMMRVKKTILRNGMVFLLEGEGVENASETVDVLLEEYYGDGRMPEEYRQDEAMCLILILRARNTEEMAEALSWNPLFLY